MTAPKDFAQPIEQALGEQRRRWAAGDCVSVESLVAAHPVLGRDEQDLLDLVYHEYCLREGLGERPDLEEYEQRFPQLAAALHMQMEIHRAFPPGKPSPSEPAKSPPDFSRLSPVVAPGKPGNSTVNPDLAAPPHDSDKLPYLSLSRYQVGSILGRGGYGIVYLARDEKLQRLVAIKVPHRKLVLRPEDAEAYLTEARTVANLDHPNIVPVYDVGSTEDCPCFVVSKYIEGSTLARRIKEERFSVVAAAELVATVAETLNYAHEKGLVHRDIKPGNILLDAEGKPYVADFGLALREQEIGKGPRYAGTPAYMSPEQARGEGHRVDGRSDQFSLGVVFYELLTGRRPFPADTEEELRDQITSMEVRPPRQWNYAIPQELDRICLKALAKRASERYTTARDMADDLRHFLDEQPVKMVGSPSATSAGQPHSPSVASSLSGTPSPPTPDSQPIKIVPKGLRSFDEHDADFFLELLPGPRDRDELPDSIRFWKTRIEEREAEKTFSVGLICGPSGCGKSSLVKAGLLPLLSDDVLAVYVEATAQETEARLLNGLRKRCPPLPANLGLKETLTALRRGQGIPVGKKVLIVLDQFEQWLHARKEEENTDLVQALRQAEGGRLQCLVMVRDDFWMAVIRFMRELEIRLLEGQNSAAVDLFDKDHARKVLAAFGRAFGRLPKNAGEMNKEQKEFLKQAVSGLSQEGKVICVRLALFAEMMKGKPWTPASLKAVGGTEGVGITFLEETFSAATAPPEHRYHQKAARADLKALLPETGSDIKGHMRSYAELLEASGYGNRPKDFEDLIHILDNEIRLITPTDPEGKADGDAGIPARPGQKYYQLTHDYLVQSIREWLTRKQKETRRGRAELLLADRATIWNARPENRQLPSLLQTLQIRLLTDKKRWTAAQRKMMRRATLNHSLRALLIGILAATGALWGAHLYRQQRDHYTQTMDHAAVLVERLLGAQLPDVRKVIAEMQPYRSWVDSKLADIRNSQSSSSEAKLRASMALLSGDPSQVEYLYARYLEVQPREGSAILDMLAAEPANRGRILAKLQAELARNAGDGDSAAKRQATVAAALLRLNCLENVWPLFKHRPDPRVRSYLVERVGPLGVDAAILFRRLEEESEVSICRALVLALGEYEENQLPAAVALPRIKKLLEAKDAGLHGAAQWLLRKWNKEEPLLQTAPQEREQRLKEIVADVIQNNQNAQARWYINSQGQTMVVIPPTGPFLMGSPPTEEGHNVLESPHNQRIARLFAICATPVTNQQFELYDRKHLRQERSQGRACPVVGVQWKVAAQYCNWLSEQENLARDQWCYETDEYGRVQRMKPNHLTLTGYRLPTEAEWEFACRAGAITSRAYGEAAELLDDYGWYLRNSDARTWPVGTKKPNDLGLFDMHGNVWNWCQDSFHLYPSDQPGKVYDDKSDPVTDIGFLPRMLRGGSYLDAARDVRCADRSWKGPLEILPHIGFRPARTLKAH